MDKIVGYGKDGFPVHMYTTAISDPNDPTDEYSRPDEIIVWCTAFLIFVGGLALVRHMKQKRKSRS